MYSYEEVISYVEEENVKFIRLAFCDAAGQQKNLTIMPEELPRAFSRGIPFDGSLIRGFGGPETGELLLVPDPATLALIPWHPAVGRMVRMFASLRRPDGSQFPGDGRFLLRTAAEAAGRRGVACQFGTEFEFYLFKTDENGERTPLPFDRAGYMDIDPGDKCESIRREICFTLMDMGIRPERAHHEAGPGQNEIDFRTGGALEAADNATTFKSVVRTIAVRNGLYASFYPKPLDSANGNGLHINLCPAGADGADCLPGFTAGILAHARELTAFLNPTEESYARLDDLRRRAPAAPLLRLSEERETPRRIELCSPDPGANPYLAFALLLYAGLDGLTRGLDPDGFSAGLETLPYSLPEAAAVARESLWLRETAPDILRAL